MKIDIGSFYIIAILAVFMFQSFFTTTRDIYDVSYSYTNDTMDYLAYAQTSFSCSGKITPSYMEVTELIEEDKNGESVEAMVLSLNKRESQRYFKPFWKA